MITVEHDGSGRVSRLTDPTGRTVQYGYDGEGRLGVFTDAAGGQTGYGYDAAGRLASISTAGGRVSRVAYDGTGRVEALVRTTDAAQTGGPTTRFAYGVGSPCATGETRTVVSDPLASSAAGHTVTYCGDPRGRVTRTVDSAGNATTVGYGATGDVVWVRRPGGGVTNYAYDSASRDLVCVQRGAASVQGCAGAGGG